MLTVATLIWDANHYSMPFSSNIYDESWVEKLHNGFRRHLSQPFDFVCYTDRVRPLSPQIIQLQLASRTPKYEDCLQPYEMGVPMILVGLDTIVTGNIDHLADYCRQSTASPVTALPRDPYNPGQACNGVSLIQAGSQRVWTSRISGMNDMEAARQWPHIFIDDTWPGQVLSWKGASMWNRSLGDARIIYFHGDQKPHQLMGNPIIAEHWR